ncbi:MAG TPA: diguanylate cyclase [Feifaniaceae bacterium]|nr:diguanylate cyclase [Feifaniaceae bacterium]
MNPNAKLLFDYLHDVIYSPAHAALDLEALPEDFKELGKGMQYLAACVQETSALAAALSKGNLNMALPPPENEMAAPLKALHAKMKHLTWQAQQIARGDYRQRIDFMGEFAEAFNIMAAQLEQQRTALLEEIENGRRKARALEQSNSLLEAITGRISQWVIVVSSVTYEWLYANHRAPDVLADPAHEPKLRRWMKRQAKALAGNTQPYLTELELQGDAGIQHFSAEIHPLSWYERSAFAFMFTDISAEREHLHHLQNAAYTDMLTQLFSRRYGMKVLSEWLAGSRPFILCFVDIDNLKYVNDRFGHAEGDQYITAVADMLRDFFPESVLCRLGGDEFMILAQGWSGERAAARMGALRTELINRKAAKDYRYDRSISYGIIEIGANNTLPANDLLSIADMRMYEYKRAYKMKHKGVPT